MCEIDAVFSLLYLKRGIMHLYAHRQFNFYINVVLSYRTVCFSEII